MHLSSHREQEQKKQYVAKEFHLLAMIIFFNYATTRLTENDMNLFPSKYFFTGIFFKKKDQLFFVSIYRPIRKIFRNTIKYFYL